MAATDKNLHVTVITPAKSVFDAEAKSVVVPAFDGEVGVMPGHAPMLALLGTGELRVVLPDGRHQKLAIRGGFLQVNKNVVTVLTPESISSTDIVPATLDAEIQKLATENPIKLEERDALETRRSWARTRKRVLAK